MPDAEGEMAGVLSLHGVDVGAMAWDEGDEMSDGATEGTDPAGLFGLAIAADELCAAIEDALEAALCEAYGEFRP